MPNECNKKRTSMMRSATSRVAAAVVCAVLLAPSSYLRAEGNCPDGYFPIGGGRAGWEGCAPMGPAEGTNDSHQEDEWSIVAVLAGIFVAVIGFLLYLFFSHIAG